MCESATIGALESKTVSVIYASVCIHSLVVCNKFIIITWLITDGVATRHYLKVLYGNHTDKLVFLRLMIVELTFHKKHPLTKLIAIL